MRVHPVCLNVRVTVCSALLLGVCGCGTLAGPNLIGNPGQHILFRGTKDYARKVAELPISPEEARERLNSWREDRIDPEDRPLYAGLHYVGLHDVLVGDCYVFSQHHKQGVSLTGYYVNGKTGEVERRFRLGFVVPPRKATQSWRTDQWLHRR